MLRCLVRIMSKLKALNPTTTAHVCPVDGDWCVYPCNKLVHAKLDAGLSDDEVIQKIGSCRMTWWRYRRGQQKPPLSVCGYLAVLAGQFPWAGWRKFNINVLNGKLFRQDLRDGFEPGEVASIFYMRQELQYWRSRAPESAAIIPFPQPAALQIPHEQSA